MMIQKIYSLIVMCLLFVGGISGQRLQRGCVRTPERYLDKKFIKAVYIPGVKIEILGRSNPTISGEDGRFDFPVNGRKYSITQVSGGKYSLLDVKLLRSEREYSANEDCEILMVNLEENLEYQLAVTKKERNNFQKQTEQLRAENERLRAQGKITEEVYQKRIREIIERTEKEDRLITDMVNEYLKWDFKGLDEYNRQFRMFRLDGDFHKMDSLQKTRGDILTDTKRLLDEGSIIIREKEDAEQKLREIALADSLRKVQLAAKADECYNSFLLYKDLGKLDSAALFIELRAAIDTTNIVWQLEAGRYIAQHIADYNHAMNHFQRALRWAVKLYGEKHPNVATSYNDIGQGYYYQGDYSKALEYFQKSLSIRLEVFGDKHPGVAVSYNDIGQGYYSQGDYSKALEYYQKALSIWLEVFGDKHPDVATSYNNIGAVYFSQGDYSKALEYYQKSLSIRLEVIGDNHPDDVAISYNNIGLAYSSLGEFSKALEYYQKALDIRLQMYGENHPYVVDAKDKVNRMKSKLQEQ